MSQRHNIRRSQSAKTSNNDESVSTNKNMMDRKVRYILGKQQSNQLVVLIGYRILDSRRAGAMRSENPS